MKCRARRKTNSNFKLKQNLSNKMSANNRENASFPIDDYIDYAVEIRTANQINGKHMDELLQDIVNKAKQYRDRWQNAEAKIEKMQDVIAIQIQKIHRLRGKLDEMSEKLQAAESMAQTNEIKYKHIYNKLKAIVLDSATELSDNHNNNAVDA